MGKNLKFSIIKKIAIILLAIIICYFIIPSPVNAASWLVNAGGKLVDVVLQLFVFLGDAILGILQNNFISTDSVIVEATTEKLSTVWSNGWLGMLIGVLIIAVGVCIAIASLGTLSGVTIGTVIAGVKIVGGAVLVSGAGVIVAVSGRNKLVDDIRGDFDLPQIRYTPYEIFSGQIPVFDVNFIEPMPSIIEYDYETVPRETKTVETLGSEVIDDLDTVNKIDGTQISDFKKYVKLHKDGYYFFDFDVKNTDELYFIYEGGEIYCGRVKVIPQTGKEATYYDKAITTAITTIDHENNKTEIIVERICYHDDSYDTAYEPDIDLEVNLYWKGEYDFNDSYGDNFVNFEIEFTSREVTNVNNGGTNINEYVIDYIVNEKKFVKSKEDVVISYFNEGDINAVYTNKEQTFRVELKKSSPGFYDIILYDFDKNKDNLQVKKEYESTSSILQNSISTWYRVLRTVALVGLLSVVIYIGIRILFTSIAEDKAKYKKMIIDWIVAICILFVLHYLMVFILNISSSLTEIFVAKGEENIFVPLPVDTSVDGLQLPVSEATEGEFAGKPVWSTSFTGYMRLLAGSYNRIDNAERQAGLHHIAYTIIYIAMVIYTLMFTFMYLKRAIYMAFLTMIAPLIALTYPLDKIKDGKAQAFGLWIREYIFNCLMQPIHLIIYIMVISSVMEYVKDYPVYALVALGFLIPAEQFFRKMFGFESAGTVSELGKFALGASVMSGINKLTNLNKRRQESDDDKNTSKVRTSSPGGYSLDTPTSRNGNQAGAQETNNQTPQNDQKSSGEQGPDQTQKDNQTQQSGQYADEEQQTDSPRRKKDPVDNNITQPSVPSSTEGQNVNQNNKKKKDSIGFGNKMIAGMNSVGMHYGNKIIKSKPLRTIGKYTALGLGAATLGTVGLAAGITSGDAGKALSYTATGMGVGGALGKTVAENVMDEGKVTKEKFKRGFQGEEEYTNNKLDKKFLLSSEYQAVINDHSLYPELLKGAGKQQERIEKIREEIMKYRESGITDTKKIVKAMKLKLSPKEGVFALSIADRIGKSGWNKEETRLDYQEKYYRVLYKELEDEEQIKKIWNAIPKLLF